MVAQSSSGGSRSDSGLTASQYLRCLETARHRSEKYEFTIRTLGYTGMRLDEFVRLNRNWLTRQDGKWILTIPGRRSNCQPIRNSRKFIMEERTGESINNYFADKEEKQVTVTPRAVHARVKTVAEAADIQRKVNPRILRETFAIHLANTKMPSQQVSEILDVSMANLPFDTHIQEEIPDLRKYNIYRNLE